MLIISENVSNLLKYLLVFKGGILMLNEYEKIDITLFQT